MRSEAQLIEELVSSYATLKTEQARAIAEARIWQATSREERRGVKHPIDLIHRFLKPVVPEISFYSIASRRALQTADNQTLWDKVDQEQMPVRTACRLLQRARQRVKKDGVELHQALTKEIESYEAGSVVKHTADGRVFRSKTRAERLSTAQDPAPSTGLWSQLRAVLFAIARERASSIAEVERRALFNQLEIELRGAIANFTRRCEVYESSAPAAVTRRDLLQACKQLLLDPPKMGHPVDLAKAKKKRAALLLLDHPDRGGSGEALESITAAYIVLETYNQQLEGFLL